MKGKTFKRSGSEFELLLRVNGRKIAAIFDTGSPISITPKNYSKVVGLKRDIRRESTRKFVDVNGRPNSITKRYKLKTEIIGIEKPIIWWEVETNTKPIIGMDNFDKLGLQLIQRPTTDREFTNSGRRNQVRRTNHEVETKIDKLKQKVNEKLRDLFHVNKTLKNLCMM